MLSGEHGPAERRPRKNPYRRGRVAGSIYPRLHGRAVKPTPAKLDFWAHVLLDVLVKYSGVAGPYHFAREGARLNSVARLAMRGLEKSGHVRRLSIGARRRYEITEAGKIAWAIWNGKKARSRSLKRAPGGVKRNSEHVAHAGAR